MTETLSPQDFIKDAKKYYGRKNFLQAADYYRKAAEAYRAREDEINAAEQMNNSSVALLQASKPQAAYDAARGTDLVFEKAHDPSRQAFALGNQAAALEELHKDDEALALYQKSASLLKATDQRELRSHVMKRISALQIRTGKKLEATASMYGALEDKKDLNSKEKTLKKLLDTVYGYMGIKTK